MPFPFAGPLPLGVVSKLGTQIPRHLPACSGSTQLLSSFLQYLLPLQRGDSPPPHGGYWLPGGVGRPLLPCAVAGHCYQKTFMISFEGFLHLGWLLALACGFLPYVSPCFSCAIWKSLTDICTAHAPLFCTQQFMTDSFWHSHLDPAQTDGVLEHSHFPPAPAPGEPPPNLLPRALRVPKKIPAPMSPTRGFCGSGSGLASASGSGDPKTESGTRNAVMKKEDFIVRCDKYGLFGGWTWVVTETTEKACRRPKGVECDCL